MGFKVTDKNKYIIRPDNIEMITTKKNGGKGGKTLKAE